VAFCFGRARPLASAIPPVKKAFPNSSTEKVPRPTEELVIRSGNLATKTDAKNQEIQYAYDAAQRLTGVSYFTTAGDTTPIKTVSFSYDAVGNLTGYNDGTSSATYVYDPLGRKTSEAVNYGAFTKSFSYAYDNANQKTSVTYPDGTTYAATYAQDGSLSSMNIPGVGVLSMTEDRGRPTGRIFPGGATRTTPLDAYGRPTAINANDPGGNPLLSLPFTFDKNDNVSTKGSTQYAYDNTDQLTGVQDPAKPSEAFGYDSVGNRLTHAQGINVTTAAFDENNELESVGGVSYTYDANGNLSTKMENGVTTVYTWDVENRLIQVTDTNGLNAQYSYDVFGRRLSKTVNGAKTFFLYTDEGLIAEMTSDGTITKSYGWKPGGVWDTDPLWMHVINSTTEPMGYFWYENDYIGAPVKMTDTSGAVVWAAVYDTFGAATVDPASTIKNNLRFPGQYFDGETGLHYNWNRYYDSATGRYTQEDLIGFAGGEFNLFRYVGNSPVQWSDPLGLDTYRQNRDLNVFPGSIKQPNKGAISHTFVYTTNPNGTLNHTYSWGNEYDKAGLGLWVEDRPEDVSAARIAIQRRNDYEGAGFCKKAYLPDDFGPRAGGSDLDPFIDQAFQDRINHPDHYSRHKWRLWNNCKNEADRLIEDAKKRRGLIP
jgi:RHS repeat-associated protein